MDDTPLAVDACSDGEGARFRVRRNSPENINVRLKAVNLWGPLRSD